MGLPTVPRCAAPCSDILPSSYALCSASASLAWADAGARAQNGSVLGKRGAAAMAQRAHEQQQTQAAQAAASKRFRTVVDPVRPRCP